MARALGKRGGEGDLREQCDAAGARNCHRDPGCFDFTQTEGEERVLCGNQLASRVIELILPYASPSVSARYFLFFDS